MMNIKQAVQSHKRLIAAMAIIATVSTGIVFALRREPGKTTRYSDSTAPRSVSETGANKPGDMTRPPMSISEYNSRSVYGPLPSYMSDVSIDGSLQVAPDGHLVRSKKIRQLFDFFLMSVNEEGVQGCSGRIEEIITMSLTGEARNEALAIWNAYKKYRLALSDTSGEPDYVTRKEGAAHFENILESRIRLRRQTMPSDVADVFFGDEEAYDRYVIERFKIQHDSRLSEKEKADEIRDMANRLPVSIAEKETARRDEADFDAEISRLRQAKNDDGVHALREQKFGNAAADRLAELDKKNDALNRRIKEFYQFEKTVNDDPRLSSDDKKQRIETARLNNFSEWERPLINQYSTGTIKKG